MKAISASLKFFLVQKLQISNKEALQHILSGRVLVNGKKGNLAQPLHPEDVVIIDQQVIKEGKEFIYLAYYKPRGIESTLNQNIAHSLGQALNFSEKVFPVGRLDKESEGLMLLTNHGQIYDRIVHAKNHQEKEYLVTVNNPLTPAVLAQLASGVEIMGQRTRPAVVNQVNSTAFNIILTQGLNRQIRRMCYKLGYGVERLIRKRLVNIELGNLEPGEWRHLTSNELAVLQEKIALRNYRIFY
ncbi:pseudouridine synthase [Adhaeribacter rhizoryzae]|uniref:Pseudouridine synthase n=1 Tax=Adhaeribacter rhizoryzae TaxID=2607907 RepID=A0A5M6D2J0_9BACT|nr:pseudouridine synthase [Adhaeribacter rhizoryzae]KAA5541226.1 pseudouridine synthase [Adhaeribacter rhizoryzae]